MLSLRKPSNHWKNRWWNTLKRIIFDFCYIVIFIPRILICFESFVMLRTQEASNKKSFKHQIGFTFFSSLYYMYARLTAVYFTSSVLFKSIQVYTQRRDIFILTTSDNGVCLCINRDCLQCTSQAVFCSTVHRCIHKEGIFLFWPLVTMGFVYVSTFRWYIFFTLLSLFSWTIGCLTAYKSC